MRAGRKSSSRILRRSTPNSRKRDSLRSIRTERRMPLLPPMQMKTTSHKAIIRRGQGVTGTKKRPWSDHGMTMVNNCRMVVMENQTMKEIAISKFKATCLAVLERVRKTGEPILVTRFGHPVAEITPVGAVKKIRLGGGASTAVIILGDIVGPIGDESDWEAAQDPETDEVKKAE